MPTAKKAAVIDDLADKLGRINAAALIEYRGLTVAEIGDLRTQLRQRDVELTVTKNTLLRTAAHRNNMTELDDLFVGPNAVAFIYGDEGAATKALNDYFRTARVGEIKSGILKGGRRLTAEQFAKLADLPNRQTLLGQIAGLLESPLSQLASLFNAPARQLAYALANFEEKGGAGGAGIQVAPVSAPEAAAPSAVESDVTETEPPGTLPADTVSGEDMGTPPVVPDVVPTDTSAGVAPVAPEDAEDGTADQVASPGAAETSDTTGGQQATATATAPEAAVTPTASTLETMAPPAPVPEASVAPVTTEPEAIVTPAPGIAEGNAAPVPETVSAPVRITSSDAAEPIVADTSRAPESEGSAAAAPAPAPTPEQATPTVRFSASLSAEPISGQRIAEDPTIAPESEGSAS